MIVPERHGLAESNAIEFRMVRVKHKAPLVRNNDAGDSENSGLSHLHQVSTERLCEDTFDGIVPAGWQFRSVHSHVSEAAWDRDAGKAFVVG